MDLGLRNPLLNYRPSRARGVEVVDEIPVEVFRILVRERKSMSFAAVPESDDGEPVENGLVQPGDEAEKEGLAARHVDLQLQTNLTSVRLQSRLKKTEYDARSSIEEQGVNTLYLALGMLCWFESDSSQIPRSAPLLLLPVALERSNVQERFRLGYTEEDLEDNLSLASKLKLEFGLEFPEMQGQEGLDVAAYFDEVEESIRSQSRWSVDRDTIALGFFSFSKLLMYRDLDEENWPEGLRPSDHPVIQTLFDEDSYEKPAQLSEDEHLDKHLHPADVNQVVDADSSQALALLDVKSGRSLVIQGPPGTGKSQTITNIIAEAVGHGRTVLFVAEKMAALEVVKRRLDSVGLGDACLELHSRKTNKGSVLQELDRTMRLGRPMLPTDEENTTNLTDAHDRLNEYSEAMNTSIGESDVTPYRAIGELVLLSKDAASYPKFEFELMRDWSGADFRRKQGLIEQLQVMLYRMGIPEENPFYGSMRTVLVPTEQVRIGEAVLTALETTRRLRDSSSKLADTLKLSPPETRSDCELLCRAARRALEAPDLEGVRVGSEDWQARREDLRTLVQAGERHSDLHQQYDEILIPEAWDQDLLEIREHLANNAGKWWRFASRDFRQARNYLNGLRREPADVDLEHQLVLVDAILNARRDQDTIREHEDLGASLFGKKWQHEHSNWSSLARVFKWILDLYGDVEKGQLPEGLIYFFDNNLAPEGLGERIFAVEESLGDQNSKVGHVAKELELAESVRLSLEEQPLTTQESTIDTWYRHLDELQSMVTYNQFAETCRKEGLYQVLQQAVSWPQAHEKLVDAYRYAWFEGLLEKAFHERPTLARFDRDNHEYILDKFRELDRAALEHNRTYLAHAHWQGVPTYEAGGQLGVLKREIQKKRRHLPIRQLIKRAGNAVQALKPVFMMSPLSIANFLEPDAVGFDLVVFDEASQVRPVEALGAIARGKQVVVVGDNKQLPPTSFFDRLVDTDEIDEDNLTSDLESVLGLFSAQGAPERMLRWHYRSRHESLITVSNHEFYENRLVVFPSPDRGQEDVGLVYHYLPNTIYDRGGTRTNVGEAKKVAEAVIEHARTRPHLTLGVAAFSTAQMQAIEDQLMTQPGV